MRGRFIREERGSAAVEFALVIGFVAMTVLSIISGSMLFYTYANLNMAVENTARWAAIRATVDKVDPSSGAVQAQGDAFYAGLSDTPAFMLATCGAGSGKQVSATANFSLVTGFTPVTIPISATSCYPLG
ncbi:TadE/TadG family type IV pilus assembly protein [Phenylobacterium sp.]|uniref:TadE/TadG family type IV pilus assembly protein n=1 Tax=Phenylobacterium sp. TaxID=1871053 RepID=UPI002ED8A407